MDIVINVEFTTLTLPDAIVQHSVIMAVKAIQEFQQININTMKTSELGVENLVLHESYKGYISSCNCFAADCSPTSLARRQG